MTHSKAQELIVRRYADVHGARPRIDYATLATDVRGDEVAAALGYRRADCGPLFLERYIDQPIEELLAPRFSRPVNRADIVEIGNLAADNAPAMVRLWAQAANDLGGEAEIAVAVLTRELRTMFRRLGVAIVELAPADPARLGGEAMEWGRYYARDPRLCAGLIASGQERLARFAGRCERMGAVA